MKGKWIGLAALASACLAPGAGHARNGDETPRWDAVAFEMRSWGAVTTEWSVHADGMGFWTGTATDAPVVGARVTRKHDLAVKSGDYAELLGILAALPDPAPDAAACREFVADMPYGIIRLTRGATTTEIAWNAGCQDKDYAALLGVLRAADAHMAATGRNSPVLPE